MTINTQSVHFNADSKLLEFVNEKVTKLTTYYDGIISCEVILKLDKSNNTENKISEIKMLCKGHEFFAKKQSATFEAATDLTCEALKTQLKKHKEKMMQI